MSENNKPAPETEERTEDGAELQTENPAAQESEEQPAETTTENTEQSPVPQNGVPRAKKLKRLPNETDAEFAARFNAIKEQEVKRLSQEFEERTKSTTKAKRRNWWIKTGLLIVLIVASLILMFTMTGYVSDSGTKKFSDMIKGMNLYYFLAFLGIIILFMLFESFKYSYLLKISTGKWRLRNSIKTMFLGRYYDGITPFATGGQPFQIYYLHKKDIPAGVATAVPLVRFIISTFAFCLVAIAAFAYANETNLLDGYGWGGGSTVLLVIAIIAMLVNFAVPVVMIFVSIFPRLGKKMVIAIISLLGKLHILKKPYRTKKKFIREAAEYKASLAFLFAKWWKLIPFVILCFIEVIIYLSVPYFAVLAIVGNDIATGQLLTLWFQIMSLASISYYTASFVPTPGNSGASEAMTTIVFFSVTQLVTGFSSVIGWVVLFWRFANYYLYIISGIGINIFEIIRSSVRRRRELKKQ